jgi:tetratricopeptide (TPR) repeat protein
MSRFSRNVSRAGLAVVAPVFILVFLEIICRIFDLGHPTRFLIPSERNGEAVWIDNQIFGYRFFAPAVSRAPTPIVIPQNKSPDEFRIVLLGESAAMGEPEPAYGPARMLEYMLKHRMPDRKITVINAAMTAINSHVIREISRDLARIQPDVVILYIGNNEVVGPYGPGTVFHAYAASPFINRLRAMLTRLRLTSAIRELWYRRENADQQIWQGMEMFTDNRVPETDPRLQAVYDSFTRNMQAIIHAAESTGASVMLSTVAVNLSNQAPFDGSELDATSIDTLKNSRDKDDLRFRADSTINALIRSISSNHAPVIFSDAETAFEKGEPPGFNLFLDHVHVTIEGSYLLAHTWLDSFSPNFALSTNTNLTMTEVGDIILWNSFNAIDVAETMLERASRPPFTATRDQAERLITWKTKLGDYYELAGMQSLDELLARYQTRMEMYPSDIYFPQQAVRALLLENRYQQAGEILYQLNQLIPHRADVRGWMVVLAAIAGKLDRAWPIMTENAPDLGQLPADLLISAAETLLQANFHKESAELLGVAAAQFPYRLRLQVLLASRLAQAGQIAQAQEQFSQLIQQHPDQIWIREEYGILLAMQGDRAGAENQISHLRTAADPASRLKWIQFLLFKRDTDAAVIALQELLQRNPENGNAAMILAELYLQQGRIEQAATLLEQVVHYNSWNGDAWAQLGNIYDLLNRPTDAIAAYNRALPLAVNRDGVLRALAWLLATEDDVSLRDPVKADVLMQRVRAEDTHTLLVRAAVHAANNRFAEAIRDVDHGIRFLNEQPDPDMLDQFSRSRALYTRNEAIRITR